MTDKVTAEWKACCQKLLIDPLYRQSLRQRLIDGTLPPLVETRLWAYAYGEVPKAEVEKPQGMIVQLGFLGFLQPGAVTPHDVIDYADHRNGPVGQLGPGDSTHVAQVEIKHAQDQSTE